MPPSLTCDGAAQLLRSHGVDEAELRMNLRRYSDAASALLATTQSKTAGLIARQVVEHTSPYLDAAGVSTDKVRKLTVLSKELMLAAHQAEKLDHLLKEAAHG